MRLASFLKDVGPQIAEELEPKMAAVLEDGEQLPDLAHLLDVLGRMVLAEWANYNREDDQKERHDNLAGSARSNLRRKAMPLLRSRVQEVRRWMRTHMDAKTVKRLLGFQGRTPRSDQGLEDLADTMVQRLAHQDPIKTPAGSVDPAGWAEYLRQPLAQVSGLLDEIGSHSEGRTLSVKKKAEAMKIYDRLFRRVARIGWIFCHLGGIERHARRLVYKGGRPGVKTKKPRGPVGVA